MAELTTPRVPKTIVNKDGKRVKRPIQESSRKRPSRTVITQMAAIRGFMTGNEKTSLKSLELRNAMQRINNRAMSTNVEENFTGAENTELQRLISEFVKGVNAVLKDK